MYAVSTSLLPMPPTTVYTPSCHLSIPHSVWAQCHSPPGTSVLALLRVPRQHTQLLLVINMVLYGASHNQLPMLPPLPPLLLLLLLLPLIQLLLTLASRGRGARGQHTPRHAPRPCPAPHNTIPRTTRSAGAQSHQLCCWVGSSKAGRPETWWPTRPLAMQLPPEVTATPAHGSCRPHTVHVHTA
jgi:hypothetical protein